MRAAFLECTPKVGLDFNDRGIAMQRPKYTKAFKTNTVRKYLNGHLSSAEFSKKHSLNDATLRRWASRYKQHGKSAFDVELKVSTRYDASFKRSVLQKMEDDGLSYSATAALFNLGSQCAVARWKRLYERGGIDALKSKGERMPAKVNKSHKDNTDKNLTAEQEALAKALEELEYLRAENAYLKKLDALMQSKKSAPKKKR